MPRGGRRIIPIQERTGGVKFRFLGDSMPKSAGTDNTNGVQWASCKSKTTSAFKNIPRTSVNSWFSTGFADPYSDTILATAIALPVFAIAGTIAAFGTPATAAVAAGVSSELTITAGAAPLAIVSAIGAGARLNNQGAATLGQVAKKFEPKRPKYTSFKKPCSSEKAVVF